MLAALATLLMLRFCRLWLVPVSLAALVAGCAPPLPAAPMARCTPGQGAPMTAFELFFGRSIGGQGEVSDSAWKDFLVRVVTPSLSSGYTVFDATGGWLDPVTDKMVRERTKVLLAVVPDDRSSADAIERIRRAYQRQFHQSSVGMTVMPVCAAF